VSQDWDPTFEAALREAAHDLPSPIVSDPTADLLSLGFDSMQLISLFITLETIYNVEFPADSLTAATTPDELWDHIQRLVANGNDAAGTDRSHGPRHDDIPRRRDG
jgi:acyl carrier protein